jgi:chemotaxis protein histidine kinase CheA/ActR/RegA family two-component response regulator
VRSAELLEVLRSLHTLKGAASSVGSARVSQRTHGLEERLRALYEAGAPLPPEVVTEVFALFEALRSELREVIGDGSGRRASNLAPASPEDLAAPARDEIQPAAAARSPGADLLRVRPQRVDALHAMVGDLVMTRLQLEALAARVIEVRDLLEQTEEPVRRLKAQLRGLRRKLPPSAWEGLSAATQAVTKAVGLASAETFLVAREAPMLKTQAAAVITALEDGLRELRLMPIEPFFEEFSAVAQKAARECGKDVLVEVRAGGAEIDRAILNRLRDPFLHLVRNAVVHGIEGPAQRRELGKRPAGKVILEAHCTGSRAILRVADDGSGVDVEAVLRKAMAVGLLERRVDLSDDDLLDLLTYPGFSTYEQVDSMAGRGIGLDVVAATVRSLSGHLTLDMIPGGGTIFTVDVPITTQAGAGLVVRVGSHLFGMLLHPIERIIRVSDEDLRFIEGRPVVLLEKDPVAVVTLAGLLSVEGDRDHPARRPGIVMRSGRRRLVLLVDELPGEQAMVIRSLPPAFEGAKLFLGGAIQGDGSILPVLQAAVLFEVASDLHGSRAAAVSPSARVGARRDRASVLVVDDSLTIRTLVRSILEAAGYAVTVAFDGVSALEELRGMPACDLIITDLQMPRLDGYGLCEAVRASDRPHTPLVVVTSVGQREEKQRALNAGADAYIVKNDFEQGRFLDLVAKLTGASSGSSSRPGGGGMPRDAVR